MIGSDDFGHDPNVQGARKYFSRMEAMDFALIKRSGISLFDSRLRTARDTRFNLYEKSCSRAARKGIRLDESMMFELCQYVAFKTCGLKVSSIEPSGNQELLTLVQEAQK
ncbi:MAG: hypothetical protein HOG03_15640 [Desulfobacula sp.]|jgi:hypothetical protein|uniref:hypothetical protein n=1 Tax=Desulfobacula sp. TaxID=2593537 RepID=UPI001EC04578|nr:hypothetical protein [Desulfobacula sp.]MBT4876623.1 hypothetical protein [Desulfobacula sp.]MBT5546044.1 hypothetical protein [Desulfobacula sp.]MBT5972998.1 hypothetical protein [Desulfobacula sp.]MBT6751044.1 hypothetical protein [Desulfobacula sp.]